MGKSKKRAFCLSKNNDSLPKNLSRDDALKLISENLDDKSMIFNLITLFGFNAEDLLDYGIDYEQVILLKGII